LEIVYISPSEVEVGEDRLRKELGDTEDLEKSIRKLGLLQPIGVTKDKKLVWGWRRLETWKKVKGDEPIPAIVFPEELSRLAELAENVCRLDLPWYLKDMAIAELHRKLEEEALKYAREEIVTEKGEPFREERERSEEKSADELKGFLPASGKNLGGRPPKPWTQRDTAEVLGISQQKVSTALSLVEAMEEYPDLKKVETEREALRMLQKLKAKEEAPEKEKEKTWKCDACGNEYGELDPVAPTRYTLCPDCLVEFETWKAEKLYDSD